ncbi:hypothetical protein, partial [Vibrio cholerae]|uniref:hypothetical protein n=1 Tax=Vibrio cholerae TaxID=666 RepID=UPI001F447FCD
VFKISTNLASIDNRRKIYPAIIEQVMVNCKSETTALVEVTTELVSKMTRTGGSEAIAERIFVLMQNDQTFSIRTWVKD